MSGVAGTLPPQSSGRRPGIEDALRLRRLQVRRGAGQAGRQRGRPAPRLAADRGRAGRHPRHHERRRDIVFPPRREQERHAGDRRERGSSWGSAPTHPSASPWAPPPRASASPRSSSTQAPGWRTTTTATSRQGWADGWEGMRLRRRGE